MNYQRQYDLLISKRRAEAPAGYSENHHILPLCMGGKDDPENIVKLSGREHFIAHLLLAKIHGGAAWYAVQMIGARLGINNRSYEISRMQIARQTGERIRSLWQDPEWRAAQSKKISERSSCPLYRQNMREKNLGRKQSDAHKEMMSKRWKGVPKTAEQKAKMSAAAKGKPKSEEARRRMSEAAKRRAAREIAAGTRGKNGKR